MDTRDEVRSEEFPAIPRNRARPHNNAREHATDASLDLPTKLALFSTIHPFTIFTFAIALISVQQILSRHSHILATMSIHTTPSKKVR